jgi:hypothetical protein
LPRGTVFRVHGEAGTMPVVSREPLPTRCADDFAFLVPGVLHQFGNLFLTIDGNALVLETEHAARAKAAIHGACERGGGALRLLRTLLGEGAGERADARVALRHLVELARVPVREAGHGFEPEPVDERTAATLAAAALPTVELATFVPVAVRALRELLAAVPTGVTGVVTAGIAADRGGMLVLRFRAPAGTLPFPLPTDAARRQLQQHAARVGWTGAIRARVDGLELTLVAPAPAPAAHGRAAEA